MSLSQLSLSLSCSPFPVYRCVVIEKCARCVVVLGVVENTVTVNSCAGIKLVTACRRLHVRYKQTAIQTPTDSVSYLSSSSQCTFHLLTATHPVLFSSSHTLTFAPYNTHYPRLGVHLDQCGLSPVVNYWDCPINLVGGVTQGAVWSLMDPAEFVSMEIPFKLKGDTKVCVHIVNASCQCSDYCFHGHHLGQSMHATSVVQRCSSFSKAVRTDRLGCFNLYGCFYISLLTEESRNGTQLYRTLH